VDGSSYRVPYLWRRLCRRRLACQRAAAALHCPFHHPHTWAARQSAKWPRRLPGRSDRRPDPASPGSAARTPRGTCLPSNSACRGINMIAFGMLFGQTRNRWSMGSTPSRSGRPINSSRVGRVVGSCGNLDRDAILPPARRDRFPRPSDAYRNPNSCSSRGDVAIDLPAPPRHGTTGATREDLRKFIARQCQLRAASMTHPLRRRCPAHFT